MQQRPLLLLGCNLSRTAHRSPWCPQHAAAGRLLLALLLLLLLLLLAAP
jgi:hypothetical protein